MGAVWGGQEQYSLGLRKQLRSRGWHVTSLSPDARHSAAADEHRHIPISYGRFGDTRRIVAEAAADVDIVHFNGIRAIYLSAIAAKGRAAFVGAKHQIHGTEDAPFPRRLVARAAGWGVYRHLDRVISISEAIQHELPPSVQRRSRVILNGVEDHGGHHDRLPEEGTLKVSYVGRLTEFKGVLRLIDAFALLNRRGIAAQVQIAGSGPLEATVRERIARGDLAGSVTFLGYQSDPGAIFADSQVCVLPSEYEGLPLSLLEAMSCSCAIVGHDVPGVRLVLEDGRNGLFCGQSPEAIADALARLDADRPLLARLRKQARDDFEQRWRIERMVDDTTALYEEAIAAHRGGRT